MQSIAAVVGCSVTFWGERVGRVDVDDEETTARGRMVVAGKDVVHEADSVYIFDGSFRLEPSHFARTSNEASTTRHMTRQAKARRGGASRDRP